MKEEEIISRLKRAPANSNAQRIVALYIAGLPRKRVWQHIAQKTFSGARAIEHISNPDTPQARAAWRRGLELCHLAGMPVKRKSWTDRIDEDLTQIDETQSEGMEKIIVSAKEENSEQLK